MVLEDLKWDKPWQIQRDFFIDAAPAWLRFRFKVRAFFYDLEIAEV